MRLLGIRRFGLQSRGDVLDDRLDAETWRQRVDTGSYSKDDLYKEVLGMKEDMQSEPDEGGRVSYLTLYAFRFA